MNEEERTELNREDGKPEVTGQVYKEPTLVNDETSNVHEEAHYTSPHQTNQTWKYIIRIT